MADKQEKSNFRLEAEQLQAYSLFDRDFSLAQSAIQVLKHFRKLHPEQSQIMERLTSAMLSEAFVSYSRPWLQSKGIVKKIHQLDHKKYVPKHLMSVHETMLDIRHREIAHTDLGMKNPRLDRYVTRQGQPVFPVGYHSTDYEHMFLQIGLIDELLVHVRGLMSSKLLELTNRHDQGYKVWKAQQDR